MSQSPSSEVVLYDLPDGTRARAVPDSGWSLGILVPVEHEQLGKVWLERSKIKPVPAAPPIAADVLAVVVGESLYAAHWHLGVRRWRWRWPSSWGEQLTDDQLFFVAHTKGVSIVPLVPDPSSRLYAPGDPSGREVLECALVLGERYPDEEGLAALLSVFAAPSKEQT